MIGSPIGSTAIGEQLETTTVTAGYRSGFFFWLGGLCSSGGIPVTTVTEYIVTFRRRRR